MDRLKKYLVSDFNPNLVLRTYNLYLIEFDVPLALTYGTAKIAARSGEEARLMLQERMNRIGLGRLEINKLQFKGKRGDMQVLEVECHHAIFPEEILAMRERDMKRGRTC